MPEHLNASAERRFSAFACRVGRGLEWRSALGIWTRTEPRRWCNLPGTPQAVVHEAAHALSFGKEALSPRRPVTMPGLTRALLAAMLVAFGSPAQAQTDPTVFAEQVKLVRAAESLPAQGPNLFGDQVNLYTGALQFAQTDISIPGNSGLPVEVRRTLVTGQSGLLTAYFGDWDLDLPALRGTYAVGSYNGGWAVDTSPTHPDYWKRCTYFAEPPEARPNIGLSRWFGYEYWFGTTLNAPGGGEVLVRGAANTQQPQDGYKWPLVTRSGWQLRCLASLHAQNLDTQYARGEGFLALSPDGTSYRFDWLISRDTTSLIKRRSGSVDTLTRRDFLIYPSQVTDRHGNWVRYNFSPTNRKQLQSITASDGRAITFSYDAFDRIKSASDGTRTWTYTYSGSNGSANLATVVRPDGSQWTFALNPLRQIVAVEGDAACGSFAVPYASPSTGSITHPSGASGSFTLTTLLHGRKVSTNCDAQRWTFSPKNFGVRSLTSRSVSGPGMPAAAWTYQYNAPPGSDPSCTSCPNTKTVSVTDPRGHVTRHTFGIVALVNEGQLLQLDEGWNGSGALRTTTYRYRAKNAGPYAAPQGYSPNPRSDSLDSLYHAPLDQRITTQQGSTFSWTASAFDMRARPTVVTRSSSLGHTKTETTAFHDHTGKWILGQLASVTDSSGAVQESHSYDATTANRTASYAFGLLQESYAYYTDGLLNVRYDQAGRPTTYSNYQRGIPQNVIYADGTTESAVVNGLGWVSSITNAAGTSTGYGYDAMGRVASITYPSETGLSYHPTTQVFEQVNSPELGIAAGHWRQTTTTGNARTLRYFDGLWRERIRITYDTTDSAATMRAVERRYDAGGFESFASDPQRSIAAVDGTLAGTAWTYDALGRVTLQSQSSELGTLNTTTAYLTGFQKRVTNPRGYQTTSTYQAFDTPSEEALTIAWLPEGATVTILRDAFGKPTSITRDGYFGSTWTSATRRHVYDAHQRLCKTVEPESGATVQAYDSAGNVAWRASGTSLTSLSACDQTSAPANRQIAYGYDARNRLTSTTYGDGSASVGRSYTADGLPYRVWNSSSTWTYGYNNRRLLTSETRSHASGTFAFSRTYDAHAGLASLSYPDSTTVSYSPNALGEATQVSGHASAVSYHPNGAIAGYTLANGIAHSTTQNTRGLPSVWRDAGVVQDAYGYDANGNVTAITDQQQGLSSRTMGYDGLDRLTRANGIWGNGSFGYDPLDNLRTSTVGSRTAVATFDTANRLSALTVNGVAQSYGYDANGNLTSRGSQGFSFDIGNRLQSAPGKASYGYDGHGRRTSVLYTDGSVKLQVYGLGGQLLYTSHNKQGTTRHVYLGSRLIAEVNSVSGTSYSHTDALGSPVARTNGLGQLLTRTRYEPYGATAAGTNPTGMGYTGHVNDADTGLVYMQQRYYDPIAGRFLSVDPVTTDAKNGGHFSRYAYADNNPYKYTDPDGRSPKLLLDFGLNVALNVLTTGEMGLASAAKETLLGALNPAKTLQTAIRLGDAAKDLDKGTKTFQTYTKTHPETRAVYCGRTSGCGTPLENIANRDSSHHMNKEGYGPAVLDKSSTNSAAIRGREQQNIDANGGARSSGGTSGNAINGISPNNPKGDGYIKEAEKEFGSR